MFSGRRYSLRSFFIRLFNWEYWSFSTVYTPIYIVYFLLCLRARSFFFFSASNPSIKNGGFLNESKKDIHAIMPDHLYPPTIHFVKGSPGDLVMNQLSNNEFSFPLIGKPDIGGRGRGVKILKNETDVLAYANKAAVDYHIQQFVSFKNEVGIFFYKYPGHEKGRISGIVKKEFLTITGDGKSSIRELLLKDDRAFFCK